MSSDQLEYELRNIEQTLHAALVRQLRVISLMALLLGVAGFFVGHFVADEQSRVSLSPLERQVADLQEQLSDVTARCRRQEIAHAETLTALNQLEALRKDDAARDATAINALLSDIDQRRAMSLRELEAHVARRVSMRPEVVTAAINRVVDEHMLQLDRALAIVERRLDDGAIASIRAPLPPLDHAAEQRPAAPPRVASSIPGSLSMDEVTSGSNAGVRSQSRYFEPPPPEAPVTVAVPAPVKKGYLFLSRSQPMGLDPVRVSDSDTIPLPPR